MNLFAFIAEVVVDRDAALILVILLGIIVLAYLATKNERPGYWDE